jgi:hypothetical protein
MHKKLITCNKYEYVINRGEYVIFLITCNMYVRRDVIRDVIRDAPH